MEGGCIGLIISEVFLDLKVDGTLGAFSKELPLYVISKECSDHTYIFDVVILWSV